MLWMTDREIIPASINYQKTLAKAANAKAVAGGSIKTEGKLLKKTSSLTDKIYDQSEKLTDLLAEDEKIADGYESAVFHKEKIKTQMETLRKSCDELENCVARSEWPFPTYVDILSSVKY